MMRKRRGRGPVLPNLRPRWMEDERRRAKRAAIATLQQLQRELSQLEGALERAEEPRRKLILSNDVIRKKKGIDDIHRELACLKKTNFDKSVKAEDRRADTANAKRGAVVPGGRIVQGGSPE